MRGVVERVYGGFVESGPLSGLGGVGALALHAELEDVGLLREAIEVEVARARRGEVARRELTDASDERATIGEAGLGMVAVATVEDFAGKEE